MPAEMTPERAAELLACATPGDWSAGADCQTGGLDFIHIEVPIEPHENVANGVLATVKHYGKHGRQAPHNAELLAAAPDLARAYLAEHESRVKAERERDVAQVELLRLRTLAESREHPLHAAYRLAHRAYAEHGGLVAAGEADRACDAWQAAGCPEEIVATADDERAAVVRWLRARAQDRYKQTDVATYAGGHGEACYAKGTEADAAADAIERGDHLDVPDAG